MRSASRSLDSPSSTTPTSATNRPRTSGNHQRRKYKGVHHTKSGRWTASIRNGDKCVHLGTFDREEDAAIAFDVAALRFRGSSAELNFPERGLTKDECGDKVMTFDSDRQKDGEIPILESVIKSEPSDETTVGNEDDKFPFEKKNTLLWSNLESMEPFRKFPQKPHFRSLEQLDVSFREGQAIGCMVNFCSVIERSSRLQFLNEPKSSSSELLENLFRLEENGFSVEIVRKHIAMREEVEKLREQFEKVKGEICKHVTEKDEIELHFEAMKEAKDQKIASLKLKRILLEEDIEGVERDFQVSVASIGLKGNNCVVEGSVKPGYCEGDGQLSMKTGKEVQKSKGGRPRNLDGFVLPCNVPEKRKRSSVLESDAEDSLPRSHKRTKHEKDVPEELIGSRVKVWWPDDQQYYEGIIESYDPVKKKHKVAYVDGDVENLILEKEQWLLVEEPSDGQQDQVVPGASTMPVAESEIEAKAQRSRTRKTGLRKKKAVLVLLPSKGFTC